MTTDPHSRAYLVLLEERSRRIARNLRLPDGKAEKAPECLRCHATPGVPSTGNGHCQVSEGVSCESCHGRAERWLSEHYLPGWRQKSDDEIKALGMLPTKDLLARARMCVSCHVGHGDAEVNHDLIAAGHPRLRFEYGAFLAVLPKHWSEREEKARYPDFEARAWVVGQAVSAEAALELLAERADRKKGKVWPEFAEYDCFACHHDLSEPSRRPQRAGSIDSSPLIPNEWYTVMLPRALALLRADKEEASEADLAVIRKEMRRPLPDQERVATEARKAAARLSRMLGPLASGNYAEPALLRQSFTALLDDQSSAGWDAHAQRYLALAALHHGLSDLAPQSLDLRWKPALKAMVKQVKFPAGFDSPHGKEPASVSE
jgi:hypothetical protein